MKKKYLFITILYAMFVFWLSIQPITQTTPDWFPYQDKVLHVILYGILSILISVGMMRSEHRYSNKTLIFTSVGISFVYGFFMEICQIFVPTRSFDLRDSLANLVGSLIGVILVICVSFIISQLFVTEKITL
ncbi:MAG: VanZ family protein [Candidatus Hydrogenedens sp.]